MLDLFTMISSDLERIFLQTIQNIKPCNILNDTCSVIVPPKLGFKTFCFKKKDSDEGTISVILKR